MNVTIASHVYTRYRLRFLAGCDQIHARADASYSKGQIMVTSFLTALFHKQASCLVLSLS